MEKHRVVEPRWIRASILVGAGFFIFALFLSVIFDPKIRILPPAAGSQALGTVSCRRRPSGGILRGDHHYDRPAIHLAAKEGISIVTFRILTY